DISDVPGTGPIHIKASVAVSPIFIEGKDVYFDVYLGYYGEGNAGKSDKYRVTNTDDYCKSRPAPIMAKWDIMVPRKYDKWVFAPLVAVISDGTVAVTADSEYQFTLIY
ncbi:MAG: hypothetical protein GY765_24680, partial [bacterium]|nr:hypothetical protein [bacterium]